MMNLGDKKMKKFVGIIALCLFLMGSVAMAKPSHGGHHHDNPPPPPPPPPPVPVSSYVNSYQESFPDCDEHTLLINEMVTEYSDNTTTVNRLYSVVDNSGHSILMNATEVQHLFKDYDHYFLAKINGSYLVIDSYGQQTSPDRYVTATPLEPDRIKVSKNLSFLKVGYGVIDYAGNEVIPVKYQSFKNGKFNNGVYITKMNGYWGLVSLDTGVLLHNEYDSIKGIHYAYKLKKQGRFGLANYAGQVVLPTQYDKVDDVGDFIAVKKGNYWAAYDAYGRSLTPFKYKKIKMDRNTLIGETDRGSEMIAR